MGTHNVTESLAIGDSRAGGMMDAKDRSQLGDRNNDRDAQSGIYDGEHEDSEYEIEAYAGAQSCGAERPGDRNR
ncbi:MAG: hypothetical protein ACE5HT_06205 [Gemmatimonadales bacterium]